MNSWFTVKVKYTKQLDDGTFKRVSEPYLLAAMTFTDAEARIYEELGALIRGEFIVTGISRTDIHDIFHYEDSDVWFKCKINFESGDGGEEGAKAKKVSQNFLVSAHSVKEAYERLHESLGGMLIDFQIPNIAVSPIVDIFPFGDEGEDRGIPEIVEQVKAEEAKPISVIKKRLDGIEYGSYIPDEIKALAKENGIVIVHGGSDDRMEITGAWDDEIGCYRGGKFFFDADGNTTDQDHPSEQFPYGIEAVWQPQIEEVVWASWAYKTDIPHQTFLILEDDETYCRGIVFAVADLK